MREFFDRYKFEYSEKDTIQDVQDMKEYKIAMNEYNKKLVSTAKTLRKNMTPEERHLWYDFLKRLPVTVRRQHNIEHYIVDFYIATPPVVIEVDGIQHASLAGRQADAERDSFLRSRGVLVLRYTNLDIHNRFAAVAADVLQHLGLSFADLKEIEQ